MLRYYFPGNQINAWKHKWSHSKCLNRQRPHRYNSKQTMAQIKKTPNSIIKKSPHGENQIHPFKKASCELCLEGFIVYSILAFDYASFCPWKLLFDKAFVSESFCPYELWVLSMCTVLFLSFVCDFCPRIDYFFLSEILSSNFRFFGLTPSPLHSQRCTPWECILRHQTAKKKDWNKIFAYVCMLIFFPKHLIRQKAFAKNKHN